MLRDRGLKTGLYTSPHLIHVRERIRINGEPVSQSVFTSTFWSVWDRLHETKVLACMCPQLHSFSTCVSCFYIRYIQISCKRVENGGVTTIIRSLRGDSKTHLCVCVCVCLCVCVCSPYYPVILCLTLIIHTIRPQRPQPCPPTFAFSL